MPVTLLAPPEAWRHMLRATLRECTYLPDPIAKSYMRQYTLDRYRNKIAFFRSRENHDPTPSVRTENNGTSVERQIRLRRSAKSLLSLLKRANEGYKRPLERVLMLSYGRIGAKKYKLFSAFLRETGMSKQLVTDKDVREILAKDGGHKFSDNWQPPPALVSLLKTQQQSSKELLSDRTTRFRVTAQVKIPELTTCLKPTPKRRRERIRQQWYNRSKFGILLPLDAAEMEILYRLLHGTFPWKAPVRRKKITQPCPADEKISPLESLLFDGPQKGVSFDSYVVERPHRVTRRFMQRIWEKIYHRTPLVQNTAKGPRYTFPVHRRAPRLTLAVKDEEVRDLFDGVDENGRLKNA
ncbi:hypothetical protein BGW36DRAFT_368404 [Talaromyces proteolyticus]|uniref:LYR motif-containing protein Cup1-like N-terminal domain-containing protein n=1 Tax=Talaromyces proteolyticus TaxID=1131652 RepID=A0AAD4L1P9_9EURO|nr:uncharacterized protein BGW36DRAFT_368404 [Talaromyces proteolyticus]KAH8705933.1 hypothetical protein BGW36DRAFT_368404 [Talaromyces proteolyticus]